MLDRKVLQDFRRNVWKNILNTSEAQVNTSLTKWQCSKKFLEATESPEIFTTTITVMITPVIVRNSTFFKRCIITNTIEAITDPIFIEDFTVVSCLFMSLYHQDVATHICLLQK